MYETKNVAAVGNFEATTSNTLVGCLKASRNEEKAVKPIEKMIKKLTCVREQCQCSLEEVEEVRDETNNHETPVSRLRRRRPFRLRDEGLAATNADTKNGADEEIEDGEDGGREEGGDETLGDAVPLEEGRERWEMLGERLEGQETDEEGKRDNCCRKSSQSGKKEEIEESNERQNRVAAHRIACMRIPRRRSDCRLTRTSRSQCKSRTSGCERRNRQ